MLKVAPPGNAAQKGGPGNAVQKGVPDMTFRKASDLWCGRPGRTCRLDACTTKTRELNPNGESHAS
jgi:hypothetical protein